MFSEQHKPEPEFKKIYVYVDKVYGACPVVALGDVWVFDPFIRMDECVVSYDQDSYLERRPIMCPWALHTLFHYVVAMSYGVRAKDLGIALEGEDGYVICPAWGPPTCEALVIWRLHPEPIEKGGVDRFYEFLAKRGYPFVPEELLKIAPPNTKELREKLIDEWVKAGRPKFWERWRDMEWQPRRPSRAKG
jgi:uncharacterized repeat protein (TIGR04076 family)